VLGKHDDVVAPLPQRRQGQREARQALVEILAEASFSYGGSEVDVARTDDPDVDALAPGTAEPAHGSFFDSIEELGLEGPGQEPHFVQEQHTPVGGLKEAGLRLPCISEGPPLEAEQLRLE